MAGLLSSSCCEEELSSSSLGRDAEVVLESSADRVAVDKDCDCAEVLGSSFLSDLGKAVVEAELPSLSSPDCWGP